MSRDPNLRDMIRAALDIVRENNQRLQAIEERLDALETGHHTTLARMSQMQQEIDTLRQRLAKAVPF